MMGFASLYPSYRLSSPNYQMRPPPPTRRYARRQEGWQEGQAELLVRILERKFGPLPSVYQQRILTAGSDDIWRWVDRVLSAEALEQVFD